MKTRTDIILNELFNFMLPDEEIDGGEFIQDTKYYKMLESQLSKYKPRTKLTLEVLSFELALKSLAIQFNAGSNYGAFSSYQYAGFFETQFGYINIDDLLFLLNDYGVLKGFDKDNLEYDSEKLIVVNRSSGEVISYENIEKMVQSFLRCNIEVSVQTIKVVLNQEESRNRCIETLAGKNEEEYLEDATRRFEALVGLN